MKKIIYILLCVLLVLMVGCKNEEKGLIGMWYEEAGGTYLTFNEDNTCRFGEITAEYETNENKLTFLIDGKGDEMFYKIENNTLTITFSESEDFKLIYKMIKQ